MLSRRGKELFYKLCDIFGLNFLFRFITKKRSRILVYHGLIKEPLPVFSWTNLISKEFRWQMEYLAAHYEVVHLHDLFDSTQNNKHSRKGCLAAITFDDGLRSVAEIAEPILENINLPATCFVNPGLSSGHDSVWTDILYELILSHPPGYLNLSLLGRPPVMLPEEIAEREKAIGKVKKYLKESSNSIRQEFINNLSKFISPGNRKYINAFLLMNKNEIVQLHRKGRILVGAHTYTHPILSQLCDEGQEKEINQSLYELKTWGIDTQAIFAYPNGQMGDYNDLTKSLLKKNAIRFALTSIEGFYDPEVHNDYEIPRIPIGGNIGREEFKALLSGLYFFLKKIFKSYKDIIYAVRNMSIIIALLERFKNLQIEYKCFFPLPEFTEKPAMLSYLYRYEIGSLETFLLL